MFTGTLLVKVDEIISEIEWNHIITAKVCKFVSGIIPDRITAVASFHIFTEHAGNWYGNYK